MGKKRGEGSRTDEIRRYLEAHPDAKPTHVVQVMAGRGIVVSKNLVSQVKTRMRSGREGTTQATTPAPEKKAATAQAPASKAPASKAPASKAPASKAPTTKGQGPKKKAAGKKATGKPPATKAAGTQAVGQPPQSDAATAGSARTPVRRGGELSADDLFEAKRLADELGGIEQARRALDYLEKLR